jgi:hypothetical protein
VREITPTIFYGGESEDGRETYSGLVHFLTTSAAGLNNNTASGTVLRTLYSKERAEQIIAKREANGGIYSQSQSSRNFTILATGGVPNSPVSRSIKAIVSRRETTQGMSVTVLYWNDNYMER